MLDANHRHSFPFGAFDLASGPVTCAACGCRLQPSGTADDSPWYHYAPIAGRDARGCRVGCVDAAHDANGRAMELSVA